jgi:arylsulfatase A-like enzyme
MIFPIGVFLSHDDRKAHFLQARVDAIGAYGRPGAFTPNLDRLAKMGARAINMFSATPICTPARAALLSNCNCRSVLTHQPG